MAGQLPHHTDEEIDRILLDFEEMQQKEERPATITRQADNPSDWKRDILDWVRSLVIAGLVAAVLFGAVIRFVMVDGNSMAPTLNNGDRMVMYSLFYQPKNGDVVILSDKTGLDLPLVKRVIATEGQTVNISSDGVVFVDEQPLDEPYVAEEWNDPGDLSYPLTVPEGKVFVLGDNRNHSTDSRSAQIGLVDEQEVLGKVVFRFWPLDRIGLTE